MQQCYAETCVKPAGLRTALTHQGGFRKKGGVVGHKIVVY